ncbi:MAG TPA: DUF742 domain-containing protein [Amycolatopsis sp.]|uniref:DUF742 domain-containing protein n=1 Tax=Amycolatopsis sp. TaxID=37632 RepID=UPI002B47ECDD|nr:DUF742 domain-containing protein [Amycolatopsis sp.]HKS48587.1 DUF742 domain-containing protein [Amycolatopsis sp.]
MTTGPGGGSPPEGEDEATFADVFNAFTLDSGRGRRKRKKDRDSYPAEAVTMQPGPPMPGPPQVPGPQETGPQPVPLLAMQPPPSQVGGAPPGPPGFFEPNQGTGFFEPAVSNAGPAGPEEPLYPIEDETAVVRPYALTGGRTKAKMPLELETLISASDTAAVRVDLSTVQFEHRSIMEECRMPRSVAEIAALLRVPLGVARVLISDAADAGLITVHKTVSGNEDAEAHFMLMERVLSGLRRL